jgi:hypothetical protein
MIPITIETTFGNALATVSKMSLIASVTCVVAAVPNVGFDMTDLILLTIATTSYNRTGNSMSVKELAQRV